MMKFFNKIRYDLMEKNKTGKYLKYAIGEIILVVVGILIALQINNWNNNKQNNHLETEYLKGIKTNLINDISELEGHFKADTIKLNAYTFLIKAINSDNIESKHQEFVLSIYATFRPNWFEGQNVVFEDLKSSGRLNLIQSDTIRYSIQKYYRFFEEVVKQENLDNNQIRKIGDKNIQYLNVSSFIEPMFQEQWNANTGPPNLSFIEKPDFILVKSKLINNYSLMKVYQFNSHKVRNQLNQKAILLKEMIELYLIEEK